MANTFKESKCAAVAAKMPPLSHWRDRSQPWTPAQSDVLAWLIAQPEVANYLLLKLHNAKIIQFDANSGFWVGRDANETAAQIPTGFLLSEIER